MDGARSAPLVGNAPAELIEMANWITPTEGPGRHAEELVLCLRAWAEKPLLRECYHEFYRQIARRLGSTQSGPVVEIGSGTARIKEVIPGCVTTDALPHPWLDRRENAFSLSFRSDSVSHLILFDVWHHLRYPGTALAEFHRVLVPGGRVIMVEPAISWIGRITYGLLHYEPVALRDPIAWAAPEGFDPATSGYYAAQGNATRQFWWGESPPPLQGWKVREVTPLVSLTYFATGGFSRPQIGGAGLYRMLRWFDRAVARWTRIFATRLIIVLEKETGGGAGGGAP